MSAQNGRRGPQDGDNRNAIQLNQIRKIIIAVFAAIGTFVATINLTFTLKALFAGTLLLIWAGFMVFIAIKKARKKVAVNQKRTRTISYSILGVIIVIFIAAGYKWLEERLTPTEVAAKSIYYVLVLDASESMQEPFDKFPTRWEAVQAVLQDFYIQSSTYSNYGLVVIGGQNSAEIPGAGLCSLPGTPIIPLCSVSNSGKVTILKDLTLENLRLKVELQQPDGGGSLRAALALAKNQLLLLPPEKKKIIFLISSAGDACNGNLDVEALINDFNLMDSEIAILKRLLIFPDKNNPGSIGGIDKMNQPGCDSGTYVQTVTTYDELKAGIFELIDQIQECYLPQQPSATATASLTATTTATFTNTATPIFGSTVWTIPQNTNTPASRRDRPTKTFTPTPTFTPTVTFTPTATLTFTPTFTFVPYPTFTPTPIIPPPPPPPPPPTATTSSPATCLCTSDLYNCSDFATQAKAQACYDHCVDLGAGDVHHLDGNDKDGIVCEDLP